MTIGAAWEGAPGERAAVTGLVTDNSSTLAIGAGTSIRNVATGVVQRAKTNSAGLLGSGSSVTVATPQLGRVLSGGSPRELQMGLRIVF